MTSSLATSILAQQGLVIDWENLPTYNTIMSVAAGAGLIMVVQLARAVVSGEEYSIEGNAIGFAVTGIILTITGMHMTLTWPLAPDFPFDNIIFGEPALAFGVLLLGAAFHGWSHRRTIDAPPPTLERLMAAARPVWPLVLGIGLGCLGIAAAGITYQLFAAPPQEPLTGWVTEVSPWIEPVLMSGLYALVGVGASLYPLVVRGNASAARVSYWTLLIAGWTFLLFGAYNFFTHIGLIVNTMG